MALGESSNLSETQLPHQKVRGGAGLGPGAEVARQREGVRRGRGLRGCAPPARARGCQRHVHSQALRGPVFFSSYLARLNVSEVTHRPGTQVALWWVPAKSVVRARLLEAWSGDKSRSPPAEAPAHNLRRGGFESRHPWRPAGSPTRPVSRGV